MNSSRTLLANSPRARLLAQFAASSLVPLVPILLWRRDATNAREERETEVRTRVRIPTVQTIDDLLLERCRPGDVVLFDRRCDRCSSGAAAALQCALGKAALCDAEDGARSVESGTYEHCGVVVPGPKRGGSGEGGWSDDPSDLHLLEATAGEGVVCRPLITRLEMSRSRSVFLLPLSTPGDRRNDDDEYDPPDRTKALQEHTSDRLVSFRDKWVEQSREQGYAGQHPWLAIIGALFYATNVYRALPIPISPSAWLVVSALQECGIAARLSDRIAAETRVEDFTRDHRFNERDTVRLRPGWKFLGPVVMRENAHS